MTTDVIYATDLYSGYNYGESSTYLTARSTLSYTTAGQYLYVGQNWSAYAVYQAPLMFNTSGVGTDTISSALLSIWLQGKPYLQTDFVLQARSISSYASLAASWVPGASLSGEPLLAHVQASALTAGAYGTLTDDAMPANINKTGTTYLLLSSARTAAGTVPTGGEYIALYSAGRTGTTNDPYITIVHAAAGKTLKVRRSSAWTSGAVKVRRSNAWVNPTAIKVRRSGAWVDAT